MNQSEYEVLIADASAFLSYALEQAGTVRRMTAEYEKAVNMLHLIYEQGCPHPDAVWLPERGKVCGVRGCPYCGEDIHEMCGDHMSREEDTDD